MLSSFVTHAAVFVLGSLVGLFLRDIPAIKYRFKLKDQRRVQQREQDWEEKSLKLARKAQRNYEENFGNTLDEKRLQRRSRRIGNRIQDCIDSPVADNGSDELNQLLEDLYEHCMEIGNHTHPTTPAGHEELREAGEQIKTTADEIEEVSEMA
ncbi:hypothetical protein [Natrialba aegyptia]|uniref:Uncharacterized protein n=1 Tax=Natrialba aegyptia DSM 13077 TaxID=1227491 RepID=M0B920_9EURY|nr:hypothetical protein [Natrialba aegyptia]ELZ06798.1 hypothetical protein C480_07192 [Natrialba aegyptia DSM 13077]